MINGQQWRCISWKLTTLQKKRTVIVKRGHLLLEVRSRLFLSWERMIKGTIPKNMVVKVIASRIPTCIKRKKSQSHHNQVTVHFNLHHCQVKERLLRSISDNRHGHVQGVHVWGCRDVVHQVHYGNLRKVQVEIFQQVQYDAYVQLAILCNEGEMSTLAKLFISDYYMH